MSGCLPCICSRIPDISHFLFPDADADAYAGRDWACSYIATLISTLCTYVLVVKNLKSSFPEHSFCVLKAYLEAATPYGCLLLHNDQES